MTRTMVTLATAAAVALALAAPAAAAPDDPYWGDYQWGPKQVNAEQAWATSTGAGATVAIVDTGVDLDHPDLDGKIVGGATFSCNDEFQAPEQPCGNGDWESGRNSSTGKGHPHGTHVAGIAAAETDNGTGIAGVAPDTKILAVKSLGGSGSGSFGEIAAGIRWSADNGADVINLSLGAIPGAQAFTITGLISSVQEATAYARSKGAVVVAAAGNEFFPLCDTPAFDRGALCVIATNRYELKASYSNFGTNQQIDVVAAPGGDIFGCQERIIATVPFGAEGRCSTSVGTPGYDFYAGTSMATPHAAGVAALLMAQGRSDDETVAVLKSTARDPLGTRGTYDPVYGYGIVDAAAAVATPLATTSPGKNAKGRPDKGKGKGKPDKRG
jgi:subtilisin family serine protease